MPVRVPKPTAEMVCPSCAALRGVRPVGTAVIGTKQARVVECLEPSCQLQWCPPRPRFALTPRPPSVSAGQTPNAVPEASPRFPPSTRER